MALSQEVIQCARQIGEYYLNYHQGDYQAASDKIRSLCITGLQVDDTTVRITTCRPGLLIGRKGRDVERLSMFLEERVGKRVCVVEDPDGLIDWLLPERPLEPQQQEGQTNE